MNKITIVGRAQPDDLPEAAVGVNIQFHFSDDAPASLVGAIGRSVAEILTAWGRDDELRRIGEECEAIRARQQRQADHAAETLLARPAAPAESSREGTTGNRAKRSRKDVLSDEITSKLAENVALQGNALQAEIALRQCYRCETVYGRRDATGCAECRPIRVLIGSEEPQT